MTGAIMEAFPASEFPYLFEMTVEHILQPGYDYGNEFDSGLTVVLNGVAALLEQQASRPGSVMIRASSDFSRALVMVGPGSFNPLCIRVWAHRRAAVPVSEGRTGGG